MAEGNGYSLADIAAAMGGNGGFGGAGASWMMILFLFVLFAGNGGWGNNSFANAIGYENLATSNEVQRGFDNQNSMANQREILAAVNSGTAQSVAATNQVFHDLVGYVGDKYAELDRDVLGVGSAVQQAIANQNACCCDTKMLIQETSAQNRYDALLNTNAIIANSNAQSQKILDALAQNKISALESQVADLRLANQMSNVVRYPNGWTYNAGPSPFCNGCGCGM
jgi:hypothetical protein